MAKLTSDEKASFAALMARLLEDDNEADVAVAEALEHEAESMVEAAEVYAAADAERLEDQHEHELALIDAQADATVRVIEAETAGATAVAAIDATATVEAADALAGIDTPALPDITDEPNETLDAAADVLAELTSDTIEPPAVPILELPDTPTVDEVIEDVAPIPQHWWTKPRGRRR